ncbi:DEAD/DEAH box helicase family protein [Chloroflexota bacterium]
MSFDDSSEIERLRRELEEITAERDYLLRENRRLTQTSQVQQVPIRAITNELVKEAVPSVNAVKRSDSISSLNSESPLAEKIRLFRSLFHGREDVYAILWQNKTTLKSGYSPVCKNEWAPGLCQKFKVKCSACPNRELAPLTDQVIQNHLEGKFTAGVYPLLKDDSCYFLAIDFDKQSWAEDIVSFCKTCQSLDIPAALERSRSGNGGHVWIFFSEAVPASSARNLGCYLVTRTMSRRHQLGMDSYDRLFPNQDTVPKGGFGNLIALPFQKVPGEKGNTLFLDENFKPYPDQWSYLASIKRVPPSILENAVRDATRNGQVLGVRLSPTEDDDSPWAISPSKLPLELLAGPFPNKVNLVASNLIYVEKIGLPSPLLNKIKRLAAFQNPEFYKKQKFRLSTALTPQIICCAEEFPKHLGIPLGLLDELIELLEKVGIKPEITDKSFSGTELKVAFHGQLSPIQKEAVSKILPHNRGILVAPSGSGKTVVGISIIASRGVNTLILVNRRPLMDQWRNQLSSFLKIDPAKIGQIGGGKNKRTGLLDVAMLQSLFQNKQVSDLVAEYRQVVVDECHHLPAFTFEQVLRQAKARYVLGLTATPYRRDGHQPIILMQCGPVHYEIRQNELKSQAALHHVLICRNTSFTPPPSENELSIQEIYSALMADEARNKLILDDILKSVEEGRSPILLTERREHLEYFSSQLTKVVKNVIVLRGGMGIKQRRAIAEQLASISESEKRVLLATGRYIGEGFDDARLDILFLALPVSWKGTLVQYAGRLHRLHAGKTDVRIYDYVDRNVPMLGKMFQKRLRGYRTMGYEMDKSDNPNKNNLEYDKAETSMPSL